MQKKKVIIKNDLEISSIPKEIKIDPTIGMLAISSFKTKIDKKGTIAEIEKNSRIPFIN